MPVASPLLGFYVDVSPHPYTFLAGGHLYGAHANAQSVCPAASLHAAAQQIRALQPYRFFALGDLVRDGSDPAQLACLDALNMQLGYNMEFVPGNHDLDSNGHAPASWAGRLASFTRQTEEFLVLNTELLRQGHGDSLIHLIDAGLPPRDSSSKTLFVFSHRLLWALCEPGMAEMDDFANEPFAPQVNADTARMVYEAVLRRAGGRKLHWFSGDVGATWSFTVFHGCSADSSRHFYAAGLGDSRHDALWRVDVSAEGDVSTHVMPLLPTQQARPDTAYGLAAWRRAMAEQEAAAHVPLGRRILRTLGSPRFWVGFGLGGACIALVAALLRRRRAAARP
jgi:hypothetical protein